MMETKMTRSVESQEMLNHYADQLYVARAKYSEAQEMMNYYKHLIAHYGEKYNQELKDPNFDLYAEMFN